jgi:hypothetical protein
MKRRKTLIDIERVFCCLGAERIYLRALEINRRCFGDEHPEVAENLNG